MDQEQSQFMMLRRLPARLTAQQAAWVLGFQVQQIPILVSVKLLHPLGDPAQSAQKILSRSEVERVASDLKWLDKSSQKVAEYWQLKNARRTRRNLKVLRSVRLEEGSLEGNASLGRA